MMVMEKACVALLPIPLLAVRVPLNTPVADGVPEMTPVVEFRVRPVGSVLAGTLKVGSGKPLAALVKL